MMQNVVYFTYQITNTVNGKIYIGVHQTTDINDGYMGSGTALRSAIRKYGIDAFEKKILEYFESYDLALLREKEIVTDEFLARKDVYNIRRGGHGGFSQYHCERAQQVHKSNKAARVENYQRFPQQCSFCFVSIAYPKRHHKFCSKACAASFNNAQRVTYGYRITEDHKKKLSKKMSGRKLDDSHKNAISKSRKGRRYIRNDATGIVKSVHENDLEKWLKIGYRIGRYPL